MDKYTHIQNSYGLYYLRILQLLFVCVVLGLCGAAVSMWTNLTLDGYSTPLGCKAPTNIDVSIAAAVMTLPALCYLMLCTGRVKLPFIPWSAWAQAVIDVLCLILWFAAAVTSNYSCNGICSACGANCVDSSNYYDFWVQIGSTTSYCASNTIQNFERSLAANVFTRRSGSSAGTTAIKAWHLGTKIGFDALMVILFFLSAAYTVLQMASIRRASKRGKLNTSVADGASSTFNNGKGYAQINEQELPLYRQTYDGASANPQGGYANAQDPLMTSYQPVHQPDQVYEPNMQSYPRGPAPPVQRRPLGQNGTLSAAPSHYDAQNEAVHGSEYAPSYAPSYAQTYEYNNSESAYPGSQPPRPGYSGY